MPAPEFSEGQFESDLWSDLRESKSADVLHFRPSQVMEKGLPFDRAVSVPTRAILPRTGVVVNGIECNDPLVAQRIPATQRVLLPDYYVNVLLQTKTSFRVTRRRKDNAKQWDACGGAFFRTRLDTEQHEGMMSLEADLSGWALTRYAMPCFWTWGQLQANVLNGTVTDRTHFQSPCRIGKHGQYVYATPLQPGHGFSEPQSIEATDFTGDVLSELKHCTPRTFLENVADLRHAIVYGVGDSAYDLQPTFDDYEAARSVLGSEYGAPLKGWESDDPNTPFMVEDMFGANRPTVGGLLATTFRMEHYLRTTYGCEWTAATAW